MTLFLRAGLLLTGLWLHPLILWPTPAHAQTDTAPGAAQGEPRTAARARSQRPPVPPRFEIELDAPDGVRETLLRHMELQRFRRLRQLDVNELNRLLLQAPDNLRDLLGTLGHFSPVIQVDPLQAPPADAPNAAADDDDDEADALPPLGTVRMRVDPGPQTRIASVQVIFQGDIATLPQAQAQREAIQAAAVRRADQPFTQSEWDSIKNQALRQLTGQRFPGGRIGNSLADIDAANQRANLYIELESGPLQRIGGIEVVGSERYDPGISERLARLSGLTPGAEYDLERLQAAQQRMAASGYFDAVFVYVEPTEQAAMLPVKVQLREARRQKLVLGVGASTDSGARLSVEHLHNRVPGIGWRARSELRLDQKDQTARTDWRSPVDDKGWQWLTEAQLSRLDDSLTRTSSQRLRWGQGQDGETLDRSVYLQYDRARVVQYLPQLLPEAAESSITANYAWSRRRFDDLVSPRRGHGLAVELGAGTTLGTDRQPFARTQARWLGLWPLDRAEAAPGSAAPSNLGRLALRLEGGAVIARDNAPVPETQLFLTGGDNSVRGYGLRDIGVPSANGGVRAGRYKAVVSVEWQRPIWAENGQRSPWENVLFVDGGAVADRAGDLRPKWGVGTGLRYNSPVGPLQVDLAYGLETRELRLHLNVGFSF